MTPEHILRLLDYADLVVVLALGRVLYVQEELVDQRDAAEAILEGVDG